MLAKLLLNPSRNSKGAILIRLLVLGGLTSLAASIASSSAYSQQSQTGQLEGRRYIGIINSAQIRYYQKNRRFADSLGQLNTEIPAQTNFFTYSVSHSKVPGIEQAAAVGASAKPLPNKPHLKRLSGATVVLPGKETMFTFTTIRCEAILPAAQERKSNYFGVVIGSNMGRGSVSTSCLEGHQELKEHQ
jgi:type II secretory pathway pseudopilin PulG